MRNYKIRIEETLSRVIEITANSPLEAEKIALEMYKNQEIILDADDYIGEVNITCE